MSMAIDPAFLVAGAALTGSLIGAVASVGATLVSHRLQSRRERLATELDERQQLYGKFIEEAAQLFLESLEKTSVEPARLLRLYSVVARIRLASGNRVLRAAEQVGARLLENYERPVTDAREFIRQHAKEIDVVDLLARIHRGVPPRASGVPGKIVGRRTPSVITVPKPKLDTISGPLHAAMIPKQSPSAIAATGPGRHDRVGARPPGSRRRTGGTPSPRESRLGGLPGW